MSLGLWCDGVPCNWDRNKSIETVSLNFPGLAGEYRSMRIPLCSILRDHISEHTFDDIMEVLAWSLTACGTGDAPPIRHDDREFDVSLGDRRSRSKDDREQDRGELKKLLVRGALVEVRGDWKMMAEVFKLPKHNENAGICWKCPCTLREVLPFFYCLPPKGSSHG